MKTAGLFTVVLAAALLSSCGKNTEGASTGEPRKENRAQPNIVRLDGEMRSVAGITTERVELKPVQDMLTLPGQVQFNRKRLLYLTARVPGRVERVHAFVGDHVQANALLATIYSQAYITSQAEFVQAQERLERSLASRDTSELSTLRAIYESARRKLVVMGAPDADIEEITRTHIPKSLLEIRSPFAGSIIEEGEINGRFVDVGTVLFRVADISTVWIVADIYEKDLARIQPGVNATITVAAYPGETFRGTLTTIFDVLEEKTRTVKARVEVPNPSGKLKPQMFGEMQLPAGRRSMAVLVPSESLVKIDNADFIFVQTSDSTFEKRPVAAGPAHDTMVEITTGLNAHERIVARGAFYLKSELMKAELGEGE